MTKRNLYPAIGIPETTYSDSRERDDPITIAAFDSGDDFSFADNQDDHAAWFSSRDNGRTWAPDHEFRPPYGKLFIRGNMVRCYDVQNWIEVPGTPLRKAIRAVRMRRKKGEKPSACRAKARGQTGEWTRIRS